MQEEDTTELTFIRLGATRAVQQLLERHDRRGGEGRDTRTEKADDQEVGRFSELVAVEGAGHEGGSNHREAEILEYRAHAAALRTARAARSNVSRQTFWRRRHARW